MSPTQWVGLTHVRGQSRAQALYFRMQHVILFPRVSQPIHRMFLYTRAVAVVGRKILFLAILKTEVSPNPLEYQKWLNVLLTEDKLHVCLPVPSICECTISYQKRVPTA